MVNMNGDRVSPWSVPLLIGMGEVLPLMVM
jgi:hypothetical protein